MGEAVWGTERFGMEDGIFSDPFNDMIIESEPFAVEFGEVYVVAFVDVCANVGDNGEKIVRAVSAVGVVGEGVRGVGVHVQCYWKTNVLVYFCLSTVKTRTH